MIKQEITYKNLDDEEVTGTFYFHLKVQKLTELESSGEGLRDKLIRVGQSGDGALIMRTFSEVIGYAYGVRGDDGEFEQDEELSAKFLKTMAYEKLLEMMVLDDVFAAQFINGMMPKGMMDAAEKKAAKDGEKPKFATLPGNFDDEDSGLKDPRDRGGALLPWAFRAPNDGEIHHMTKAQLADVMRRVNLGWAPPVRA